jgi:HEXXH motif-containing protein
MDPAFLLLPAPGSATFPRLARKVRLLALRTLLTAPRDALPPGQAAALAQAQRAVAEAARDHKSALLHALGSPDVLAPLLVLRAGLRAPGPLLGDAVPRLLLALSQVGVLGEDVLWEGPLSGLIDVHADREWTFSPPCTGLRFGPDGAEARLHDSALVRLTGADSEPPHPPGVTTRTAFHRLPSGAHLATLDSNPLADIEAHPDKHGNTIDFGGHTVDEWTGALVEAMGLVEAGLPGWYAELGHALRRIVPVGFDPRRHVSATYREAPGLAYLSLHPNRVTLAEAIVHEVQHTKLNTLLHLDRVLENGRTTWTPSPVRPDLRPLEGVLLAVHAFVPVAALHATLADQDHPLTRDPWFGRRRQEVLSGNTVGMKILSEKGQWTPAGLRLWRDLCRVHAALLARAPEPPPADSNQLPG